jgi:two-component system, NarL family, response regulator NreC
MASISAAFLTPSAGRARIVLVDDHAILREGLRALLALEPDIDVVGEAEHGDASVALIEHLQPDIVVTDLSMPGRSGIHVIGMVRQISPRSRVLVLTVHNGEEYIRAALSAGADGYVLKDASRADLLLAIRRVYSGQRHMCAQVAEKIVTGYLGDRIARPDEAPQALTDREREVLTYIALGKSNKRIAMLLALSVKTIEKHRSNFMRKLELHNTVGVTMYAITHGMVSAGEVTPTAGSESPRRSAGDSLRAAL